MGDPISPRRDLIHFTYSTSALSPHATLDRCPPRHALSQQLLQCDVRLALKTPTAVHAAIPADAAIAR